MACAVGPSVNPFQNKGNATYDFLFYFCGGKVYDLGLN